MTRYRLRVVHRVLTGSVIAQQLRFNCWRLRIYISGSNAGACDIDGAAVGTAVAGNSTTVVEYGGAVVGGLPVAFEQMLTFANVGARGVVLVEEYLDPLP